MSLQLHNSYTFWLSRLTNSVQDRFNRELEILDITWPQWMVMSVIVDELADCPAGIAGHIGIDRSAVSRLVVRLEKKGYLSKHADESDRRSVKVVITGSGQKMVEYLNLAAELHQESLLKALGPAEAKSVRVLLQKMLLAEGVDSSAWVLGKE